MREEDNRYQQRGKTAAQDQTEGNMTEAKGRIKESWGALTDNDRLQAEGRSDQRSGSRQRTKGHWKQRVKNWIDRF